MRKWLHIVLILLPVLSCVGQKDDPVGPGGTDPDTPGEGVDPAGEGKVFFRRSLVLDFTGTWCVNCPKMDAAIAETMEARPGRIVPVSVHCMMVDPMYVKPLSDDLVKRFGISAYPSAVVDLDPESLITQSSPELLQSHIDRLLATRETAAGIRMETTLDKGDLTVEAELKAVRDGDYTIVFLVLEDGIVASQSGSTVDHVHNNVLRQWMDGETVALKEGESMKRTWTCQVTEKQRLVVLALLDGLVDNVTTCAVGGKADYQYEKESTQ